MTWSSIAPTPRPPAISYLTPRSCVVSHSSQGPPSVSRVRLLSTTIKEARVIDVCFRAHLPPKQFSHAVRVAYWVLVATNLPLLTIVVGVIGVLQALEVIKILAANAGGRQEPTDLPPSHPTMTIFAAFESPQWRTFRVRQRKEDCISCGRNPEIIIETLPARDYDGLCIRPHPQEIGDRVTVQVLILRYLD
jgi:molybdopterin/thiamine biosynthesis adenylyltransferase